MPREIKLGKPAWISAESMRLIESMDEKTGEKKLLLEMNLIPFGKVSRNGILYNKEATLACLPTLVGRPLLDNHNDEAPLRESSPFGHFIKAWYDEATDMAKGIADMDPEEKDIIRKIRRGDIAHCSIQVLAGRAVDREMNGQSYAEAYPDEFLEASLVKIEGFKQATLVTMIAEAFRAKEVYMTVCKHCMKQVVHEDNDTCPNCGEPFLPKVAPHPSKKFKKGDNVINDSGDHGVVTDLYDNGNVGVQFGKTGKRAVGHHAMQEDEITKESFSEDITQPRPGETTHVQVVGGDVQGKKCPNCGSDKILAAPNVENGYSCSKCGNQYSEPKQAPKEDVTTGNAGGMVGTAMPKPTDPFDLKKFKAMLAESEKAAREYAEHYTHS